MDQERTQIFGNPHVRLNNQVRLSLCMIVRDNAHTLSAALESIRPWVDEMIVVDTGSTDETPEIAKSLGAKVFHFPWCDCFSTARNESIRYATGEWVFWMDSDDTIDEANGQKLRKLADQPLQSAPCGYVMQVHCPGREGDRTDVTVVDHVKMFRNRPELRFEGRIHEQVLPAIRRLGGEVQFTDIYVVHSGADQSAKGRRRKQLRDLRLLELELQDRPNHPFALFNLGMTYADIGQHEKAIEALDESLAVSAPTESHVRKVYALLASSLTQLEVYEKAENTCIQGLEHYPHDAELWFRRGIVAQNERRWDDAIRAYRQALSDTDARHFASIDHGITGFKARHNLAVVYGELDRPDMAELHWRRAVEQMPGYRQGWRGLAATLLAQRKFATTEVEVERLFATPDTRAEGLMISADLATHQGNLQRASEELATAVQGFPADRDVREAQCKFLFEHGSAEDAQTALARLVEDFPEDGAAHHNLGLVYLRTGRHDEAIDAFERSLVVRPASATTQLQLGHALHAAQRTDEAIAAWQAAAKLDPSNAELRRLANGSLGS